MKCGHVFCVLAAATILFGPTSAGAQPVGHGFHPPMPDQEYYLQCRLQAGGEPTVIEVPVKLPSPSTPAELQQTVELPAPLAPLQLKRYLPRAVLEQNVVRADEPHAVRAVQVSIDGPKQSFQRWLVANDRERNRLTSFIGTWRYMCVADQKHRDVLFAEFTEELTHPPRLLISRADGSDERELPVSVGDVHVLNELGCTLRVCDFYPHFGISKDTAKPVNQSERRLNPAVRVELERDGKKEERWAFARFPDFKMHTSEVLPVRIRFDCPLEQTRSTPDFAILTVGGAVHEV